MMHCNDVETGCHAGICVCLCEACTPVEPDEDDGEFLSETA